jgi:hypothetical protein
MEQQKHDVYSSVRVDFPKLTDNKEFRYVKNVIIQTVLEFHDFGMMYKNGLGTDVDMDKAIEYFKWSAEMNNRASVDRKLRRMIWEKK